MYMLFSYVDHYTTITCSDDPYEIKVTSVSRERLYSSVVCLFIKLLAMLLNVVIAFK